MAVRPYAHSQHRGPQLTPASRINTSATPLPELQGPLVTPALKYRDWRELACRCRAGANGKMYVPPSGEARTSADGSVGRLGTKDSINFGPQIEGLHMRKRVRVDTMQDGPVEPEPQITTEDQRAICALLAGAEGDDGPEGPIIPMANCSSVRAVPTEDDAFKQDLDELPGEATLEDYERVPVSVWRRVAAWNGLEARRAREPE